jgi:hypothetical protein
VGVPGTINLNSVEYDSCPLYQIGIFTPINREPRTGNPTGSGTATNTSNPVTPSAVPNDPAAFNVYYNRLAIAGCNLNLQQDWTPVRTKLQFDIWNSEEVKFTGAFECADSWHETVFADPSSFAPTSPNAPNLADQTYALAGGAIDSAAANFTFATLQSDVARYRVQGVKSTQCPNSIAVGVVGVQSTDLLTPPQPGSWTGTTLAAAGKFSGKIVWDPEGVVPEGGIR